MAFPFFVGRVVRNTPDATNRLQDVWSRRTIVFEPWNVWTPELRALEPERRLWPPVPGEVGGKSVVPEVIAFREPEHNRRRTNRTNIGFGGPQLLILPPAASPNRHYANVRACFLCHGSAQGDLRHVIEVGRRGLDLRITQQDESNNSAGFDVVNS